MYLRCENLKLYPRVRLQLLETHIFGKNCHVSLDILGKASEVLAENILMNVREGNLELPGGLLLGCVFDKGSSLFYRLLFLKSSSTAFLPLWGNIFITSLLIWGL